MEKGTGSAISTIPFMGAFIPPFLNIVKEDVMIMMLLLVSVLAIGLINSLWLPLAAVICFLIYRWSKKRKPEGDVSLQKVALGNVILTLILFPLLFSYSQQLYVVLLSYFQNDLKIMVPVDALDGIDRSKIAEVNWDYRRVSTRRYTRYHLNSRFYVEFWSVERALWIQERRERLVDSVDGRVFASVSTFALPWRHVFEHSSPDPYAIDDWGRGQQKVWNAYLNKFRSMHSYSCYAEVC